MAAILLFFSISQARMYNPETGRYLSPDPIGLEGGLNLFVYTENDPVNGIDPEGLETWVCTKPLDVIGDKGEKISGTKSGPDIWGNPLYHKYLCIGNPDAPKCGGQSSKGGKPYAPGTKSKDVYRKSRCKSIEPANECLERCIDVAFNGSRPFYGVIGPFTTNCKEWADDILKGCRKKCKPYK